MYQKYQYMKRIHNYDANAISFTGLGVLQESPNTNAVRTAIELAPPGFDKIVP